MNIIKVNTATNHNIDNKIFKEQISKTADLIRYVGKSYLDKLKELNDQYEIPFKREVSERELLDHQIDQLHKVLH